MSDKDLYENWRRAGREEPPASLDARILAAAHEAAGETKNPRRPSWIARFAPVTVAAVAVLGVALSMRVADESPELRQSLPPPAAPAASSRAAPAAAPAEKTSREFPAKAESRSDRLLRDDPAAASADARESLELRGEAVSEAVPDADAAVPRRKRAAEATLQPRAPAAPAAKLGAAETAEPVDAASWLVDIERLLAAGETEQARQSLQRFRIVHPGYPLPESLTTLGTK